MARQPRLDLPGISHHIVQRGNNRLPCLLDDTDRDCYRQLLREALLDTGCGLHAYVLRDNHVHPPHPCYLTLGTSPLERQATYRALFDHSVSHDDTEALRAHTQQQRALGSERFRAQAEALTQRAASVRPRGRPPSFRQ